MPTALTTAPDGGWTQVTEPHAVEHDGILYFCFIDGDDGHIKVGTWDGTTTTLLTLNTAPEVDTHDAPTIHIRASDLRLMVWWSGHNGPELWQRISTNPLDISSWEARVDLDAQLGGTAYTYPSVVQLLGEANDPLYLFYRDTTAGPVNRIVYSKSVDGGTTWAAQTVLLQQTGRRPYAVVDSDGDTRIDIAVASGNPLTDDPVSVHHLSRSGGAWSAGTPPFTVTALPVIYDGAEGLGWANSIITNGARPTVGYIYLADGETHYRIADAPDWDPIEVADAGALLSEAEATVIALTDVDTAYASVKVSGVYELQRFDRAADWTAHPVTASSAEDNIFPVRVHDGASLRVLWLRGAHTSYLDNSLAVWGDFRAVVPAGLGTEWGVVAPGPSITVSADVANYLNALGMEWGVVAPGPRVTTSGKRQVMLTGEGIETPEMTTGGEAGQILVFSATSVPAWADNPGGTPATTVEGETAFGIAPAVGSDTEYARGDHTHGTPSSAALEALGVVGALLISDDHSTPIVFADLLLTEDGDDLLYADIGG